MANPCFWIWTHPLNLGWVWNDCHKTSPGLCPLPERLVKVVNAGGKFHVFGSCRWVVIWLGREPNIWPLSSPLSSPWSFSLIHYHPLSTTLRQWFSLISPNDFPLASPIHHHGIFLKSQYLHLDLALAQHSEAAFTFIATCTWRVRAMPPAASMTAMRASPTGSRAGPCPSHLVDVDDGLRNGNIYWLIYLWKMVIFPEFVCLAEGHLVLSIKNGDLTNKDVDIIGI